MGLLNCNCQVHYYPTLETTFVAVNKNEKGKVNNINNKLTKNFNNKEIDPYEFLKSSKYSNLINEKILNYITKNKFNYKFNTFSFSYLFNTKPFEFPEGNIFFGNIKENKGMEGYGLYILKNKNVIVEGIWKKGNLIFGRIFFPNEDIYEGEITQSMPNGRGKIFYANGDIYKGDFKFGEITGKGTYIYEDKTYYCGDLTTGIFNGEGSMKWSNGVEYHGIFYDSSLNIKGKIYNDILGEKFIGNFENNEFNGNGIYKYQNGDIYEGNFVYGLRSGKGIYKIFKGIEYIGMWENDLPNGEGEVKYNKYKIKGKWKDGIKTEIIEILEGDKNILDLENIDLNIKTSQRKIIPSSLPHLNTNIKTEISEYVLLNNVKIES